MDSNTGTSSFCSPRNSKNNQIILNKQMSLLEYVTLQEVKFVKGELDLDENLKKTDVMYSQINTTQGMTKLALYDSQLIYKQSDIIYTKAKDIQANSRHFVALEFGEKIKKYFLKDNIRSNKKGESSEMWSQLGDVFKTKIHSTPSFHFMYGSFDNGTVVFNKKTRMMKPKDVISEEITPKSINLNNSQANQDTTTQEVERIFNILMRLYKKHGAPICYFEFITDPESFSRTVENIFHVSFLVKEGAVRLISDDTDLPVLVPVGQNDLENNEAVLSRHSVLSISIEDWKNIIKTFKVTKSVIRKK